MMALSRVVLPAPFGPMTVAMRPASTARLTAVDGADATVGDVQGVDPQGGHATEPR